MTGRTLEERVTALENVITSLQTLPGEIAAIRRDVNARFEQIDARFEQVDARFDKLERLVREEDERLYSRMRMLHEELIDQIRIGRQGPNGRDPGAPSQSRRRPKR